MTHPILIKNLKGRLKTSEASFAKTKLKRSSENEKHPLIGVNSFFRRPLYILTI
ncbi:hypothetical protein HMPREF9418_1458 [Neisseria macacae ATCC 33926]|uniref:Uncharacterized protein n=1 Tax=Neisseria macacae ATCC 33926 TaxID=997348 RepID=A0AA36UJA7_9NEIS|nr:hypothetical protein HMPREF9418_1458 [Neisseria macacae ATCC 33926]